VETNTIQYACTCGRTWAYAYEVEIEESIRHLIITGPGRPLSDALEVDIKEKVIYLSRIVEPEPGTPPPDDALCTCGKQASASLETPMPGYRKVVVRLLTPVEAEHQEPQE
jgi:hypothetical protein